MKCIAGLLCAMSCENLSLKLQGTSFKFGRKYQDGLG
jgi:hypothetical protein